MTLSRFLRDYLYFALGGNRKGSVRRYINLLATMLLGGFWHGAGWTFIIWGSLHGIYLVINHGWHQLRRTLGHNLTQSTFQGRLASRILTFVFVVIGWVFFRAENLDAALAILKGMGGFNGINLHGSWQWLFHWRIQQAMASAGIHFGPLPAIYGEHSVIVIWIIALWSLVWLAPNTQQILAAFNPTIEEIKSPSKILLWRPNWHFAVLTGLIFAFALCSMRRVSEFLYFQF